MNNNKPYEKRADAHAANNAAASALEKCGFPLMGLNLLEQKPSALKKINVELLMVDDLKENSKHLVMFGNNAHNTNKVILIDSAAANSVDMERTINVAIARHIGIGMIRKLEMSLFMDENNKSKPISKSIIEEGIIFARHLLAPPKSVDQILSPYITQLNSKTIMANVDMNRFIELSAGKIKENFIVTNREAEKIAEFYYRGRQRQLSMGTERTPEDMNNTFDMLFAAFKKKEELQNEDPGDLIKSLDKAREKAEKIELAAGMKKSKGFEM